MTYEGLKNLKRHEGLRLRMYQCSEGYNTIGYGFNLDANEIPREVAELLLSYSTIRAEREARSLVPEDVWDDLTLARRDVLIEMVFQLGLAGVRKFTKMLAGLGMGDAALASTEMLDSKWAKQTPERAREMAAIMKRGCYGQF